MGLFRSSQRAFRGISDALGLLEADAATTEFENGPVRPRLDVQASLESGVVRYSQFVFGRTDGAGGITSEHGISPHVLGNWSEIANRNKTEVGVAGSEVPPGHDAWIIEVGITNTAPANWTEASIWRQLNTAVAGSGDTILWHGAVSLNQGQVVRNAALDSPILLPLPWWLPPVDQETGSAGMLLRLVTSNAVSTVLTFGVLSAPQGVFRRLY